MFGPWIFVTGFSVLVLGIQFAEYLGERHTYASAPIKRKTKPAILLVGLLLVLVSGANAAHSYVESRQDRAQSVYTQQLAGAAATNAKTKPLSKQTIYSLSANIRSLAIRSVGITCDPHVRTLCAGLERAVSDAGITNESYEVGYPIGASDHSIVINAGPGHDADAESVAGTFRAAGLDAVAEPYDVTYKPGTMNTPLPDLHIAVRSF